MSGPSVEFLDHTADLRVRFRAPTMEKLVETAARALGEYLYGPPFAGEDEEVRAVVDGGDGLARFVAALNEALFILQERRLHIRGVFLRDDLTNWQLTFLTERTAQSPSTEIKAATYHEAVLRREGEGWLAEITFDL
jgi:SHS2 domain-containing protein